MIKTKSKSFYLPPCYVIFFSTVAAVGK